MSERKDKTEASWPYFFGTFFGFLPALVLFLIRKDQPRTRANAAQVLNLEIGLLVFQMIGMFFWFIGIASLVATVDETTTSAPPGFGVLGLIWLAMMGLVFFRIALYIWLGIKASKGEDKTLRFVPKLIKP